MVKYTIRRFFEMILTLFLIATATFFLLEAVPGDPLTERANKLPVETRAQLYERYGLDRPMMERYVTQMVNMAQGDFGESFVYAGQTVEGLLHDRLPVSARLGIQQMLLGVTVGLGLGILAATKRGRLPDYLVVGLSVLLISIPLFFSILSLICFRPHIVFLRQRFPAKVSHQRPDNYAALFPANGIQVLRCRPVLRIRLVKRNGKPVWILFCLPFHYTLLSFPISTVFQKNLRNRFAQVCAHAAQTVRTGFRSAKSHRRRRF